MRFRKVLTSTQSHGGLRADQVGQSTAARPSKKKRIVPSVTLRLSACFSSLFPGARRFSPFPFCPSAQTNTEKENDKCMSSVEMYSPPFPPRLGAFVRELARVPVCQGAVLGRVRVLDTPDTPRDTIGTSGRCQTTRFLYTRECYPSVARVEFQSAPLVPASLFCLRASLPDVATIPFV